VVSPFTDRTDAGRQLVEPVTALLPAGRPVTVVGLPRGGVVVGASLVEGLRAAGWTARLDLVAVAKVVAPEHPELALGAVTERATVRSRMAGLLTGVDDERLAELIATARRRLADRVARLPAPTSSPDSSALLVDDGLATGATAEAAIAELRATGAPWVGLAVPVADSRAWQRVREQVDAGVTLRERAPMQAVSVDYRDFAQLEDDVVLAALARYR
jgi:putative phosphoribosyl transferase